MIVRKSVFPIAAGIALSLIFQLPAFGVPQSESKTVDFATDIKPIFENYCIACHGPTKDESFRIDVRDDAMEYIAAGEPDNSDIYVRLISDDEEELMPPPGDDNPLSDTQITLVKTWIEEGAEWPEDVEIVEPTEVVDPTVEAAPAEPSGDETIWEQLWVAVGPLHLAIVHIPIGLLLAAGLFALLGIRGNFVMSDCAYYCLWLGTLGSILACVVGWSYGIQKGYGGTDLNELLDMEKSIFWHRASGIVVTVFAFLLALFAAGARNRDPDDGVVWKLGLMVLALAVGFTGHKGGELTHGAHLYDDLLKVVNSFIPIGEVEQGDSSDRPTSAIQGGGTSDDQDSNSDDGESSQEDTGADTSDEDSAGDDGAGDDGDGDDGDSEAGKTSDESSGVDVQR